MRKSVNQVLGQCVSFHPALLTAGDSSRADSAVDESFELFDAKVGFHGYFELQDYQAFSFIGIHFVNDVAVECVVSLGRPTNPERYSSEYEVMKVFAHSLEGLYHNGRVQQDDQEGRVYTWKKDDNVVSFISYPPEDPTDVGVRLGIQIRDTQLHPHGSELELWYNETKKRVAKLKFLTLKKVRYGYV
jgi:hypothetical protein